jgi:hypothetical protein
MNQLVSLTVGKLPFLKTDLKCTAPLPALHPTRSGAAEFPPPPD